MTGPDISAHLHRLRARLTGQIDRQIRDRPPQPPITVRLGEADASLLLTLIDRATPIEPSVREPANKPHPPTVRITGARADRARQTRKNAA